MNTEQKKDIDRLDYEGMLRLVRYATSGHPYFVAGTEVCEYFAARMGELKKTADHVRASKSVGWDGP